MKRYKIFYLLKPIIPRYLQIICRRRIASKQLVKYKDIWPINIKSNKKPENWPGWPEGKKFAFILTHDVETVVGVNNSYRLIDIEKSYAFKSSFNFVPEKYIVPKELFNYLRKNEFEIGVHGLKHDGKLFFSNKIFSQRAVLINQYLNKWDSVGFYAPAMHHNLEWIHELNIKYDSSTFDVDPFEPQPDGVNTIFPFYVIKRNEDSFYLELPYTLPQDFMLFVILKEKNIDIWKKKLDWIVENNGMVLLKTHPDYMNFHDKKMKIGEYPVGHYIAFLEYINSEYKEYCWHVLPKEICRYLENFSNFKNSPIYSSL